jgi:hypothetical protein
VPHGRPVRIKDGFGPCAAVTSASMITTINAAPVSTASASSSPCISPGPGRPCSPCRHSELTRVGSVVLTGSPRVAPVLVVFWPIGVPAARWDSGGVLTRHLKFPESGTTSMHLR